MYIHQQAKNVFMTDLQHLIKFLKNLSLGIPRSSSVEGESPVLLGGILLHTRLPGLPLKSFLSEVFFSFKTSSAPYVGVFSEWWPLWFVLHSLIKEMEGSFTWGLPSQIISINVWCIKVTMSFKSGRLLICDFIERCHTCSSVVVFVCSCALHSSLRPLPRPQSSTPHGAEIGTQDLQACVLQLMVGTSVPAI